MRSTERDGVDIAVALQSGVRRPAPGAAPSGAFPEGAAHPVHAGFKARLKALLRRGARAAYRLVRPVTRPLAFRMRAYLAVPLQTELQQLRQTIAQERSANRRWRESTEKQMAQHAAQVLRELRASQAHRPMAARPASSPSDAMEATLRLVGRVLRGHPGALIARLDATTEPEAALARAQALLALQPDTAFLIDWPGTTTVGGANPAPDAQAWQRFFAQAQLSFAAVQAQGDIAPVRLDASPALRLFVARSGSRTWLLAESAR